MVYAIWNNLRSIILLVVDWWHLRWKLEKPLIKKTQPTPQSIAKKLPIGRNSATPELLWICAHQLKRVLLICKSSLSFPFGLAHVLLLLICGNLFASREKSRILTRQIIQLSNHSLAWFICLIRFQSYCGTSYGLWFNYEFGLFGG